MHRGRPGHRDAVGTRLIRRLTPADAAAALDVVHAAFAEPDAPSDPPPGALRETLASIGALVRGGGGACAEASGLQAVVFWHDVDDGLYLSRLAVRPAARRLGLARAMIDAAEAHARARQLGRLVLGTRLVWTGNRRLFAKLGFRETGLETHLGFDVPTSVGMEKALARDEAVSLRPEPH